MKFNPKTIAELDCYFTIPIYQRLFEWDADNILTLLKDLKNSMLTSSESDYCIGMLTSTVNNELVDGQQRFTVMMLLGCVFQEYVPEWKLFLKNNEQSRLRFHSRQHDETYLQAKISGIADDTLVYKNAKMQSALNTIQRFMKEDEDIEVEDFAKYIFEHLVFFISKLPERYSPIDLNRYFERMNTSGKNLEQHEVLKVKLLSNLNEDVNKYMQLWNLISEVDVPLIRKRTSQNESEEAFRERKQSAFKIGIKELIASDIINDISDDDSIDALSIAEVEIKDVKPVKRRITERDSRSALRLSYLLLNTLYWKLNGDIEESIDDFFSPPNLLSIFSKYLPYDGSRANQADILDYIRKLVTARLALDICFVRTTEFGYTLDMNSNEDNNNLKKLLMFESMLFVSSNNYTHYKWFGWLMDSIKKQEGIPSVDSLFHDLKYCDDKEHIDIPSQEELSYGEIRYWFWRLDYYIWEHRKELFGDNAEFLRVADNYVFSRNRSIEHVAPQTPEIDSDLKWDQTESDFKLMNSFGNLVMISHSLNSVLRNNSFEVKFAHVLSYCNGSKTGSIESLKLLMIYRDYMGSKWTKDTIVEHGNKMFSLLLKSYNLS